jgi:hypothetical protein
VRSRIAPLAARLTPDDVERRHAAALAGHPEPGERRKPPESAAERVDVNPWPAGFEGWAADVASGQLDIERETAPSSTRAVWWPRTCEPVVDVAQSRVPPAAGSVSCDSLGDVGGDCYGRTAAAHPDYLLPKGWRPLQRWPATLHPDHAERCYYNARESSRRWVGGLTTRGGTERWERIKRCGDPVAVMRLGDGAVSWQHRWCRDRACYACARSRSRRLGIELREACTTRPAERLYFLTLTQPKDGDESCGGAWNRWLRSWQALRHDPAFKGMAGGVRVTEVTYSLGHAHAQRRVPGWHVHGHLIVELREAAALVDCPTCDGSRKYRGKPCHTCGSNKLAPTGRVPLAMRELLAAWCRIVARADQRKAASAAQCAVPVDVASTGQLAKYLTKLWDLPTHRATELFAAAADRRLIDGFGAWRCWRKFSGSVERTPHGWVACGVTLRALELLPGDTQIDFSIPIGVTMDADDRPKWRPMVAVARMAAADIVDALRRDSTPVWVRVEQPPPPETAAALVGVRSALAHMREAMHRGMLGARSGEIADWAAAALARALDS